MRAGISAEHLAWACAHLAGADAARPLWRLEAAVRMTGGGGGPTSFAAFVRFTRPRRGPKSRGVASTDPPYARSTAG